MPDGDVLVIERCYNFGPCKKKSKKKRTIVRLRRFKAKSIVRGAKLKGEEIAVLKYPLTVDNFEGVAMRHDDERDETLVYLLSDDNGEYLKWVKEKIRKPKNEIGKPKQRTLLLMFALEKKRE